MVGALKKKDYMLRMGIGVKATNSSNQHLKDHRTAVNCALLMYVPEPLAEMARSLISPSLMDPVYVTASKAVVGNGLEGTASVRILF